MPDDIDTGHAFVLRQMISRLHPLPQPCCIEGASRMRHATIHDGWQFLGKRSIQRMSRSRAQAAVLGPVLGAAMAAAAPAAAQISEQTFRSGRTGDLATLCATSESSQGGIAARAWCNAFIVSAGQYHGSVAAANPSIGRIYCLPDTNMTLDQVRTAFVGWAQSNPQYADTRAVDGLMRFAGTTWPCPRPAASDGTRR
jgi:hypothetical protein